ncbi:MAG: glycosyltransferase [Planctomycetia bacterium]|nr:glycosyltransferase [Planctomycetia bacterium]
MREAAGRPGDFCGQTITDDGIQSDLDCHPARIVAKTGAAGLAHTDWPRISIVTPSFNQAQYIEETIRSVVTQGYPNLEYIVIDGGSTDGSQDVIRRYADQMACWVSEPDRGQSDALNKGFSRATGQICGFLNSDDLYRPGTLQMAAEAYLACRTKDRFWHAFGVEDFDENGPRYVHRPKLAGRLADWVDNVANLHQPGVFWSRELHAAVGGFDPDFQYAFDRKFFAGAILKGYRFTVDAHRIATNFRYHSQSKTATVGDVDNFGFAPEFIRISEWMREQASFGQQLRIRLGRVARRHEKAGNALLQRNSPRRMARLGELFLAGIVYPPVSRTRYYWGAVRRGLFG